jgi:hypothetical protein
MKKVSILLLCCIAYVSVQAQSTVVHLTASYETAIQSVPQRVLQPGMIIGYKDYAPGSALIGAKQMTPGFGKAYAELLMKAIITGQAKDFMLRTDVGNFIATSDGIISITYFPKKKLWSVAWIKAAMYAKAGARAFWLRQG